MSKVNKKYRLKLILGIAAMSLLGLLTVFMIGNTFVRQIFYRSVVEEEIVTDYVTRSLWAINISFAAVLVVINVLTALLMTRITKSMEESKITEERLRNIINASPLACWILDENFKVTEANNEAVKLFKLKDSNEQINSFIQLSPEYQPDGRLSSERIIEQQKECFNEGSVHFEWMHQTPDGKEEIPCEVYIELFKSNDNKFIICFVRDLREIRQAVEMVHQLENAAYTDALTGANNRRYFDKIAPNEAAKCEVENKPYSLMMLDVDFFKKVNDTYGHQVGDEVLKILVSRLRHTLKKGTLVTRWGGEEFIATLPGSPKDAALKAAERVRIAMERTPFKIKDLKIPITISIGVVTQTRSGKPPEDMVALADEALYKAKQTGRDKVVFYESK